MHVACFTNSIRETAHLMLEKTGILEHFELVLSNQDVVRAKPSPEGYLKVLDYFGTSPKQAVIVEDSPKGLEAAHASGCHVIAVKNPEDVQISLFAEFLE